METLLLEIGTEEIPAGYIEPALASMSQTLLKKMTDLRIDHGKALIVLFIHERVRTLVQTDVIPVAF